MSSRRAGGQRSSGGVGRVRLCGGPNGLAHEHVIDVQRARMLAAMTQVVAARGAASVTVAHVVERAGVSRRTFYELFAGSEECLLAAVEDALARARERVLDVYEPAAPWSVRIRAGLLALLGLFDEQPASARLLVVESLAGGSRMLELRRLALEPLIAAVEEGRWNDGKRKGEPVALTGEAVVGGVLALIHAHLLHGDGTPVSGMVNQLMSVIVLPYQGAGAARRELERRTPLAPEPVRDHGPALTGDPFKEAGMRLTYRTMRVLGAIAANPGISNRRVGVLAEMSDQGQISKLLARLERLGLIANSQGLARGEANAWSLTATGRQVINSIGMHTERQQPEEAQR